MLVIKNQWLYWMFYLIKKSLWVFIVLCWWLTAKECIECFLCEHQKSIGFLCCLLMDKSYLNKLYLTFDVWRLNMITWIVFADDWWQSVTSYKVLPEHDRSLFLPPAALARWWILQHPGFGCGASQVQPEQKIWLIKSKKIKSEITSLSANGLCSYKLFPVFAISVTIC
jgi:hypothetical protein